MSSQVQTSIKELHDVLNLLQGVVREPITDKLAQAIRNIEEATK